MEMVRRGRDGYVRRACKFPFMMGGFDMAPVEPTYRGDDSYRAQRAVRQDRGFFISTEARPAFITSEFWLTILGVVGLVILAFASDDLGERWGLGMATALLLGFVLSRGIAKAGSNEVVQRSTDDL